MINIMEKTILLKERQANFVSDYAKYGYSTSDDLVNEALASFQKSIEQQKQLLSSASLYAELYEEDEELREWTEAASQNWE